MYRQNFSLMIQWAPATTFQPDALGTLLLLLIAQLCTGTQRAWPSAMIPNFVRSARTIVVLSNAFVPVSILLLYVQRQKLCILLSASKYIFIYKAAGTGIVTQNANTLCSDRPDTTWISESDDCETVAENMNTPFWQILDHK